ncbi:MAG TPA: cytochrome P450, partial [Polyangiaceae bacterium]|nr:cytochrome P450 [Polyangiaceae bacterium]
DEVASSSTPCFPPGPRTPALLQAIEWGFRRVQFLEECAARYGEIFTIRLGKMALVVTARPSDLRQLFSARAETFVTGAANQSLASLIGDESLFVLDGADHRRVRRLCLPAFSARRMDEYGDALLGDALKSLDDMPHGSFRLCDWLDTVLQRVIARVVFGLTPADADYALLLSALRRIASTLTSSKAGLMAFPELQRFLGPLAPLSDFRSANEALEALARRLVHEARGSNRRPDSFLASLVAERDGDRALTDDEVLSQVRTFVVAGVETVVSGCAWTLRWVLDSPELSSALRSELDACSQGGPLVAAQVAGLGLLDACVRESLRLSPPTASLVRIPNEDLDLEPFLIPAGTPVLGSIYLAHHRSQAFAAPLTFDPLRFRGTAVSPYEWLPFGGGERRCIGMHVAMHEIKLIVAAVVHHRNLTLHQPRRIRPVLRGTTLAPSGGLRVRSA